MNYHKLGTNYGGWIVPKDIELNENSIIYSGGVGEDISFDLILSHKFNSNLYLIDPTKRSIKHFEEIKKFYNKELDFSKLSGDIQKDYYENIKDLTPNFEKINYLDIGLWEKDTELKFYKPTNSNYVSHSLVKGMASKNFEVVKVNSIKNLMEKNRHNYIDLLKLDIEGAEIEVLTQMLDDNILPQYLLIEFDLFLKNKDPSGKTKKILERLKKNYTIICNDNYNITLKKNIIKKMNNIVSWSEDDLKENLEDFSQLYKKRYFKTNPCGMRSPHLFPFYFMLKTKKFENVIESGIWKGQGTWLIDQVPEIKKIFCIDIVPKVIEYKSKKAEYFYKDFSTQNFNIDKDKTLCFFDDHQNAFKRIKTCKEKGYKHLIFEDNYPLTKGDCISIKKIIDLYNNKDFDLSNSEHNGKYNPSLEKIDEMYDFINKNIKTYYEFPPIFSPKKTRWDDNWEKFPVKKPLYENLEKDYLKIYKDENIWYTYICYIELN